MLLSRRLMPIFLLLVSAGFLLLAVPTLSGQAIQSDITSAAVVQPHVSCSPAPCVLPNVQVSTGNPQDIFTSQLAATVAVNPNNPLQILVGGGGGGLSGSNTYSSNNGGTTWRKAPVISDPVPAFDSHGIAYVVGDPITFMNPDGFSGRSIELQKSSNNGVTWGIESAVLRAQGATTQFNSPWLAIDTNPGSSFRDTLYVSSIKLLINFNTGVIQSQIVVSRSTDGGSTFTTVPVSANVVTRTSILNSNLTIGADGAVYVAYVVARCKNPNDCGSGGSTASILTQKSTDGGKTWSATVTAAQLVLSPFNNPVSIAADPTSVGNRTRLFATFHTLQNNVKRVQVVSSTDGGATWGAPRAIAPASARGDEFYPWVSVSTNGQVGVSWLDRRNDPANVQYQPFAAYSVDGGNTFSANIALSNVKSAIDARVNLIEGSERSGNAWSGNTHIVIYPDTRTGVTQLELAGSTR